MLLKIADGQVDELCCSIVRRERAPCLDGFADDAIQAFNGIGRVDDLSDRWIKGEERDHFLPCPPPGRGDRSVFRGPFFLKRTELGCCLISGYGPVNRAQIDRDGLKVLPARSSAICLRESPLVSAIRTASLRNSSVLAVPMVHLLCCTLRYQRSGTKPGQDQMTILTSRIRPCCERRC